jgi:tRNA U55 pseudouridine synthase TruB
VRLELHVSSGTYVRAVAEALGGHCTSLRRTAVGPFAVEEAGAERLLAVSTVLDRLPDDALARVPEGIRTAVLELEAAA